MILRSLISSALALLMVLTSHSMAVARGAPGPADQMVLCIGSTAVVVYVDVDGAPMQAPHFCPECLLLANSGAGEAKALIVSAVERSAQFHISSAQATPRHWRMLPKSRAPPPVV